MNRTAGFERKQIRLPKDREVFTGDPEMDLMVGALRALEHREGERRGWDQHAHLYLTYMLNDDAMEVRIVPEKRWVHFDEGNPVDAVMRQAGAASYLALTEQEITPAGKPLLFADSPDGLAGVALMVESWAASMSDLTEEQERRMSWGERIIKDVPTRREIRQIFAADLNGNGYSVMRIRGEKDVNVSVQTVTGKLIAAADAANTKKIILGDKDEPEQLEGHDANKDGMQFGGRLVRAMIGLAAAARLGTWPLDPHRFAGTSIPDVSRYREDLFRPQNRKFTL